MSLSVVIALGVCGWVLLSVIVALAVGAMAKPREILGSQEIVTSKPFKMNALKHRLCDSTRESGDNLRLF